MAQHIAERLQAPGPKRILSLDGGGTRGIVTIAFLERIEAKLRAQFDRDDMTLSDYFDLIGGTSVGSLLATMLALGWETKQVRETFQTWAPQLFNQTFTGGGYDGRVLFNKLRGLLGTMTLGADDLKTGLAVLAKRSDTNSVWVLVNNPNSRFYRSVGQRIGNGEYLLRDILRAATAAPTYYSPVDLQIHRERPGGNGAEEVVREGRFIDGAVSPHNNPALRLFKLARLRGHNLGGAPVEAVLENPANGRAWDYGPENLLLISCGAGSFASNVQSSRIPYKEAANALVSMIGDAEQFVLATMQAMSVSPRAAFNEPYKNWHIDRDVGDLIADQVFGAPMLTFQRYDLRLEEEWLLGQGGGLVAGERVQDAIKIARIRLSKDLKQLQDLINLKAMKKLDALARAAAEEQVNERDFPSAFNQVWNPAVAV